MPSADGEATEDYCRRSCQRSRENAPPCKACPRPPLFSVNWDAFKLFMKCRSQFRYSFNGPTGLDYNAVKIVADSMQLKLTEEVMDKLRIMEEAHLSILDKLSTPDGE